MTQPPRSELAALIRTYRDELLATWRSQVRALPSARDLDVPTLNDHIPNMLAELADMLDAGSDETIPETLRDGSPPEHGNQRFDDGFDIAELVAEYNILRGCVHDLAQEHGVALAGRTFHILNRVLDSAIGLAVETYVEQQALAVKQRRDSHLAFVAHDLRNPLTAISLATILLEESCLSNDDQEQRVRMISTLKRNVAQLESLVAKVLEDTNISSEDSVSSLHRRDLDLWPLVTSVVQDMEPLAKEANVRIVNEVPFELVVHADGSLMRRVYQNLIGNAIAYTPRGNVRLGAAKMDEGGMIECWVTDDGAGINADRLHNIFEKGKGDPSRKESKGLGLAIVKTFVEAHGGTVSAENLAGAGAIFRFTIPPVTAKDAR